MFYRIRLVFNSTDLDPIQDVKDKVLDHWDKAQTINPGMPNAEPSILLVEECTHDSQEPSNCKVVTKFETPS